MSADWLMTAIVPHATFLSPLPIGSKAVKAAAPGGTAIGYF
jgi:hypothetical protein